MNYILQVVGSIIIGGVIFLLLLNLNFRISNNSAINSIQASNQEAAIGLDDILQTEFSLIGYGEINPINSKVTNIIDTSGIEFRCDVNSDGVVDIVKYYTDLSKISGSENPNDINLYRVVNGNSVEIGVGVTRFSVHCYDIKGAQTFDPSEVSSVKYEFTVQSLIPYYDEMLGKKTYTSTSISRLIKPKNFK